MKKIFLLLLLFKVILSSAQVSLPAVFSDNMMLQREKPIAIWGKANSGETVTVTFNGQTKSTKADVAGKWSLELRPMKASAKPAVLMVKGSNSITLKNILVGDIWLCGGQSNMEYPLDRKIKKYTAPKIGKDPSEAELTAPKPDAIRYLYVEKDLKKADLPTTGWITGNDTSLKNISAIGYFFAKEIYTETGVPVGIIHSNWGGTRIEPWTPAAAYRTSSVFSSQVRDTAFKIDGSPVGNMYKSLIEPMMPFGIKGILWYQGESNCMISDQSTYNEKVRLMLDAWRSGFRDKALPFYYVQIAPYVYTKRNATVKVKDSTTLAEFWEAQTAGLGLKNTGMTVSTDLVDDLTNIHPSYKWTVAHRLALIALAKDYGKKSLEFSGPVYQSVSFKDGKATISFTHASKGLKVNDGKPVSWFSIAGEDGAYVPADAVISGNKVIVSSPAVKEPKYVRFAWSETAQPNLYNTEGLPAVPFRTGK